MKEQKTKSFQKEKNRDKLALDSMTLPGIILTLVFCYLPMVGLIIAFKTFNPNLGIFKSPWCGFDNFRFFFMSNDFGVLMRNTLLYAFWFIFVDNFFAMLFAILCYNVKNKLALKYYQTTSILPTFMSMVLVSYIVYIFLAPSTGVLNSVINALGGKGPDWYADPKFWPYILTIVRMWSGMGYGSLLYYATIVGIDASLFEAAIIDGANKRQQIIHIIVPELSSLLCLKIIMGIGGAMSGDFGLFYQIPRNIGLLYPTTDIFNTYVFRALQAATSMGRTTAIGLFQSLSGIILLLISNTVIKKIDSDKSMF